MTSLIELIGITKTFQVGNLQIEALRGIDLEIKANEFVAIVGASGSGKSTMMSILGCLDWPTSGSYFLKSRDVAQMSAFDLAVARNREIGFIFQSFNLLPRSVALANVMLPLIYRGTPRTIARDLAHAALVRVGLGDRLDHLPSELSGGQRQRVAVARALCTGPALMLADEPTGNLDSVTAAEVMSLFAELHNEGSTVVIVTHDPQIAERCSRQIVLRDGRVMA